MLRWFYAVFCMIFAKLHAVIAHKCCACGCKLLAEMGERKSVLQRLQIFGWEYRAGPLWCPHTFLQFFTHREIGWKWCPHGVLLKYDWHYANLFDFPRNGVPLRMVDFPPACLPLPAHQVAYTKIVFQTIPYLIQCVQVRMNLETWLKEWEQSSPWIPVRKPISRESNTINQRF